MNTRRIVDQFWRSAPHLERSRRMDEIPEDLKHWHDMLLGERSSDIKHLHSAEDLIELIERIAKLTEQLAECQQQCMMLSAREAQIEAETIAPLREEIRKLKELISSEVSN